MSEMYFKFRRDWGERDEPLPVTKEVKKEAIKDLDWNPIDYTSAKQKYRFNIYSMRFGASSRYMISQTPPTSGWWNEVAKQPNMQFEEAKTKDFLYCRILKSGVPEQGFLKIAKKGKTM